MKLHIKRNKKSIAYISLVWLRHNGHLEIEYLRVEKEFRGQGLASKLLEKAKKIALEKETVLVGLIDPHPDSSLTYEQEKQWMERRGFKQVKRYDFGGHYKRVMVFNQEEK
jgi:ribosomal protein S18 acetylase RimI-like enzyme